MDGKLNLNILKDDLITAHEVQKDLNTTIAHLTESIHCLVDVHKGPRQQILHPIESGYVWHDADCEICSICKDKAKLVISKGNKFVCPSCILNYNLLKDF